MSRVLSKGLIKIIIFLMVISTSVYASNNYGDTNLMENTIIKPYFTNISSFTNMFEMSSYGKASVSPYLAARNIDRLTIEVNLQQFKDGKWISIKSWTESYNGISGGFTSSYYVPKGYIYRAVSKGMVYKNGLLLESASIVSKMESY